MKTNNEEFYLYSPGSTQKLYTSPQFSANSTQEFFVCITKTDFASYDLEYSQPRWDSQSWIEFRSIYNTVSYKYNYSYGIIRLVLYTPLLTNSNWFLLSNREIHWTDLEWSQRSTQEIQANSIATTANTKHIFVRKVLRAPSTQCAAYEVKVKYKHGVVVYVNGYEVFRDNMSSGLIESTSVNVNSYNNYEYRGPVRNGYELGTGNFVIAIEIHADETITDFDCWLSVYGSTWTTEGPSYYYYPIDALYEYSIQHTAVCDYNFESAIFSSEISLNLEAKSILGQCNGFAIFVPDMYKKISLMDVVGINSVTNEEEMIYAFRVPEYEFNTEYAITHGGSMSNYDSVLFKNIFGLVDPIGVSELRPIIKTFEITRYSPTLKDIIIDIPIETSLKKELVDPTDFACTHVGSLPRGFALTDRCMFTGSSSVVGSHAIPIIAYDELGPQYFTLVLTITNEEQSTDMGYDESYKVIPIIFTVLFCIIVVVLAVFASIMYINPSLLPKKSKKLECSKPSQEV